MEPPAPVNQRRTLAPDQLFGGVEEGHLALPGKYSVSLSKFDDGILTELVAPVSFSFKLLEQGSIPTDMNNNVQFYKQVTEIRLAVTAANDLVNNMDQRIKNIQIAALDMPASAKAVLEKNVSISKQLAEVKIKLFGDQSKARRDFETLPSINERVSGIEGSVWSSTAPIPKTFKDSYATAAKQFSPLLDELKAIDNAIEQLEKELEINNAPYTPGRWPDWKGN
jgi:hypothetical protein